MVRISDGSIPEKAHTEITAPDDVLIPLADVQSAVPGSAGKLTVTELTRATQSLLVTSAGHGLLSGDVGKPLAGAAVFDDTLATNYPSWVLTQVIDDNNLRVVRSGVITFSSGLMAPGYTVASDGPYVYWDASEGLYTGTRPSDSAPAVREVLYVVGISGGTVTAEVLSWGPTGSGSASDVQYVPIAADEIGADNAFSLLAIEGGVNYKITLDELKNTGTRVVNVKQHGALGDGVADDSAAISAAAALATGGGTLYFPPGTYRNSTTFTSLTDMRITGDGATIQATAVGINAIKLVSCTDIKIDSLEIVASGSGGGAVNVDNGIYAEGCTGLTIESCKVSNHGFAAISCRNTSQAKIVYCEIGNAGTAGSTNSSGIFVDGTTGAFTQWLVHGNRINGTGYNAGISFFPTANDQSSDIIISGNVVSGMGRYGIICYATLTAGTDIAMSGISITGNRCEGNGWGGIYVQSMDNVAICGNTTTQNNNGGTGSGIEGGIHSNGSNHVTISGNVCHDEIGDCIRVSGHASYTQRRQAVSVSGNVTSNPAAGSVGIWVNANLEGAAITGNRLDGGSSQMIYVDGTTGIGTYANISGNYLDGAETASRGIDLNGALSGGVVSGNTIKNVTGPGIRLASVLSAVVDGNDVRSETYALEMAGTIGDATITHNNRFVGTTKARLVTATFSSFNTGDVLTPQDFGAVGDGVTSDVIAVQSCISAAMTAGGVVYFPPGDYNLAAISAATYTGTLVIDGAGRDLVTITGANTAKFAIFDPGSSIVCRNVKFDTWLCVANIKNNTGLDPYDVISFTDCAFNNVVISPCSADNGAEIVTELRFHRNISTNAGYVNNAERCGGFVVRAEEILSAFVTDNEIRDVGGAAITGPRYGIYLGAVTDDARSSQYVAGNRILTVENSSLDDCIGIICYGRSVRIHGNSVHDVTASNASSIDQEGIYTKSSYSSIVGNTLVNCGGHEGAIMQKGGVTGDPVTIDSHGNSNVISGNTVLWDDARTIRKIGIHTGMTGTVVSSNIIEGATRGINVDGEAANVIVSGNNLRLLEGAAGEAIYGIYVYNPQSVIVQGNHLDVLGDGNNSICFGIYVQNLAGDVSGTCVVANNRIANMLGTTASNIRAIYANPEATTSWDTLQITGNIVATTGRGIFINSGDTFDELHVTGNILQDCSTSDITITGTPAALINSGNTVDGVLKLGNVSLATAGTGSPESVLTAPVGSLYVRTDGTAGNTLYVKESGTGNTGWAAK